jgi:hypothetical protein
MSDEMMSDEMMSDEMMSGEMTRDDSMDQMITQDHERDSSLMMDMMNDQTFMSSPNLLVGKGAQEFVMIEDGEVSTLHRGCQGAQHLWVSLRLPTHTPDAYGLELTLVNQNDELLAPPFTLEEEEWLAYDVSDQEDQGSEIIGLTLVIFDPISVVGLEGLIKTKVFIGDEVLESRVWVEVQWGADAC